MERLRMSWKLFLYFARAGCFTFGVRWSIIAQMQTDLVEKRSRITGDELMDFTAAGKSLPGVMIVNVCCFTGYHMAEYPGA